MFPIHRLRRLRQNAILRDMLTEITLNINDFILPIFVREGKNIRTPISSMPNIFQVSIDNLVEDCKIYLDKGIKSILLFGIPDQKDETGLVSCHCDSIVPKAISKLKQTFGNQLFITADVCNCEYTSHGHCGTIINNDVDNDSTLQTLALQSVTLAQSGADLIAPSAMMDGSVKAIREALDLEKFSNIPIMAYSAKFASGFYSPFREAADSAPQFGDRKTYQMNPANSQEAMREIQFDIEEGADIVMVKPALSYLDIIRQAKNTFNIPIAAYNVSGEYSMIKAAAQKGWIDEQRIMLEVLTSIKRAGADIVISYFTPDVADLL